MSVLSFVATRPLVREIWPPGEPSVSAAARLTLRPIQTRCRPGLVGGMRTFAMDETPKNPTWLAVLIVTPGRWP